MPTSRQARAYNDVRQAGKALSPSFASTALHTLVCVALLGMPLHAAIEQSPSPSATFAAATQIAFSIADVHAVPLTKGTHMSVSSLNGDRFVIHHATMVDMISLAYGVESGKILGGPLGWTTTATRLPPSRREI